MFALQRMLMVTCDVVNDNKIRQCQRKIS